jgi:hypothetical protein
MGRRHPASPVLILAATLSWSAMFILQVIIYLWHVSLSKYIGWIIFKLTILNVQAEASVNEESLYFVFRLCQMAPKIWHAHAKDRLRLLCVFLHRAYLRYGGRDNQNASLATVAYNVEENKWEILPPMSQQLGSCHVVFFERKFHCNQEYGNNVECFI